MVWQQNVGFEIFLRYKRKICPGRETRNHRYIIASISLYFSHRHQKADIYLRPRAPQLQLEFICKSSTWSSLGDKATILSHRLVLKAPRIPFKVKLRRDAVLLWFPTWTLDNHNKIPLKTNVFLLKNINKNPPFELLRMKVRGNGKLEK